MTASAAHERRPQNAVLDAFTIVLLLIAYASAARLLWLAPPYSLHPRCLAVAYDLSLHYHIAAACLLCTSFATACCCCLQQRGSWHLALGV